MASNGDLTPARRVYSEEPSTRPRQVLIHLCVEGTEVQSTTSIAESDVREATAQVVEALSEEAKRLYCAAHPESGGKEEALKYWVDSNKNGFMNANALIACMDKSGFNFEGTCQVFFTIEDERPGDNVAAAVLHEDDALCRAVNFLKNALGEGMPFLHALPQMADLLLQLDAQVLCAQEVGVADDCRTELGRLATGDYTGWMRCATVCAAEYRKLDSFLQEFLVNQMTQAFDALMETEKKHAEERAAQAAEEQSAAEAAKEHDLLVHPHIICDICDASPLVGFRYKSKVLHDYDLCQACFDQLVPQQQPLFERLPEMMDISTPRGCPVDDCTQAPADPEPAPESEVFAASASSWEHPADFVNRNDGVSEKSGSKGTTGSFMTFGSGLPAWVAEEELDDSPTRRAAQNAAYEAPDPTLPKHGGWATENDSASCGTTPKSIVFLDEGALEQHEQSESEAAPSSPADSGDFVECGEDDVWSLEDVKTEVSEKFCEDDVAIYVIDEDENVSLDVFDDQCPTKKLRMLDGYDDDKYESLSNAQIIHSLDSEVVSIQGNGNIGALSAIEWKDFAERMAQIPGPVRSSGALFLGKITRDGGIVTIVLRNNSETHYPADTTLKLVAGTGGGFGDLPLAALEPQETVAISLDFPAGIQYADASNCLSYWMLSSEGYVFGNMFCVMRV